MKGITLTTLIVLVCSASACLKDPPSFSGTVCFEVEHHDQPVQNVTVYHKTGGERSPGFGANMLALYDTSIETGLRNTLCIENLSLGRHYFAGLGYDELIRDSIRGSIRLDLDVRSSLVDTVLSVSERH